MTEREDITGKLAEWRDATNVRKEVRDLAGNALAEIERLRAVLAFVQCQRENDCEVDYEPCTPVEFCKCAEDAKKRTHEQEVPK